jgi:hypothetical protein
MKIILPLLLLGLGLNNNMVLNNNNIFLDTTVNKTQTTYLIEDNTELNESESLTFEEETTQENTNPISEFVDEFVSPILISFAGINLTTIITFVINLIVKAKKEKATSEKQAKINNRIDELYDTIQSLFALLRENNTTLVAYNETIKKVAQKFVNGVEKLKHQHGDIEELENLLLAIVVCIVNNNKECLSNGTTEEVMKVIDRFKGK